jgi:spore coat polysaccharide biosynthesis predicted glycosyltransferase SpsG
MIHCVFIPAFEDSTPLPDILLKRVGGRSLLTWAVRQAKAITQDVFVLTNSEQVGLMAERAGTQVLRPVGGPENKGAFGRAIAASASLLPERFTRVILLWPYTPNLSVEALRQAFAKAKRLPKQMALVSTQFMPNRMFHFGGLHARDLLETSDSHALHIIRGFCILDRSLLDREGPIQLMPETLSSDTIEIRTYQDLWVCEKLQRRKRIVFRVIGSQTYGMGHIYRSLALAHDINDHEIIFVCDEESMLAARSIAATDYRLEVFPADTLVDQLLDLSPHLVVNDMLDTDVAYMARLHEQGILTCNFEDLGPGAELADMVVNELYDTPIRPGDHYLWGYQHYFLRDEFSNAKANDFEPEVRSVLITYGGTDINDLTRTTLAAILPACKKHGIHISIITGGGYAYINELVRDLARESYPNIEFSHATNVISKIMERSQVAFTSNGRTTYELAHMNIPAVVTAQNKRETTHHFATEQNGFINLGIFQVDKSGADIATAFERLLDPHYRARLHANMVPFDFNINKRRVIKRLTALLEAFGPNDLPQKSETL